MGQGTVTNVCYNIRTCRSETWLGCVLTLRVLGLYLRGKASRPQIPNKMATFSPIFFHPIEKYLPGT